MILVGNSHRTVARERFNRKETVLDVHRAVVRDGGELAFRAKGLAVGAEREGCAFAHVHRTVGEHEAVDVAHALRLFINADQDEFRILTTDEETVCHTRHVHEAHRLRKVVRVRNGRFSRTHDEFRVLKVGLGLVGIDERFTCEDRMRGLAALRGFDAVGHVHRELVDVGSTVEDDFKVAAVVRFELAEHVGCERQGVDLVVECNRTRVEPDAGRHFVLDVTHTHDGVETFDIHDVAGLARTDVDALIHLHVVEDLVHHRGERAPCEHHRFGLAVKRDERGFKRCAFVDRDRTFRRETIKRHQDRRVLHAAERPGIALAEAVRLHRAALYVKGRIGKAILGHFKRTGGLAVGNGTRSTVKANRAGIGHGDRLSVRTLSLEGLARERAVVRERIGNDEIRHLDVRARRRERAHRGEAVQSHLRASTLEGRFISRETCRRKRTFRDVNRLRVEMSERSCTVRLRVGSERRIARRGERRVRKGRVACVAQISIKRGIREQHVTRDGQFVKGRILRIRHRERREFRLAGGLDFTTVRHSRSSALGNCAMEDRRINVNRTVHHKRAKRAGRTLSKGKHIQNGCTLARECRTRQRGIAALLEVGRELGVRERDVAGDGQVAKSRILRVGHGEARKRRRAGRENLPVCADRRCACLCQLALEDGSVHIKIARDVHGTELGIRTLGKGKRRQIGYARRDERRTRKINILTRGEISRELGIREIHVTRHGEVAKGRLLSVRHRETCKRRLARGGHLAAVRDGGNAGLCDIGRQDRAVDIERATNRECAEDCVRAVRHRKRSQFGRALGGDVGRGERRVAALHEVRR